MTDLQLVGRVEKGSFQYVIIIITSRGDWMRGDWRFLGCLGGLGRGGSVLVMDQMHEIAFLGIWNEPKNGFKAS